MRCIEASSGHMHGEGGNQHAVPTKTTAWAARIQRVAWHREVIRGNQMQAYAPRCNQRRASSALPGAEMSPEALRGTQLRPVRWQLE